MSMMDPQAVAPLVIEIARRAGAVLRKGFAGRRDYTVKSTETDLVTEFDTQAEALIIGELRAAFPDHRIHAEESGRTDDHNDYTWFIDPLDGTNNFAHGLPHFCTSIALYHHDQPLVGVIHDPLRQECFWAVAGQGAWLMVGDEQPQPLHVTTSDQLITSILVTGFPYDKHLSPDNNLREFVAMTQRVRGIRRYGSAALDLAYVAAGRFDGYWESKLSPWDVAAGALLVTEAGGRITDYTGQPLDPHRQPVALIASNGMVHEAMMRTIREARAS